MATEIPSDIDNLLDQSMKRKLFDTVAVGKATYYFIDQYDDEGGEPVIIRKVPGEGPKVVDDILAGDDTSGGASEATFSPELQQRLKAIRGSEDRDSNDGAAGGAALLSQAELNKRLRKQAIKCADRNDPDHLSSRNAPGTDHGNLACAWAVNRVTKMALGREIGGGLSTASMVVVLREKHKKADGIVSGCVIISPTVNLPNGRRNIGHVGIVGEVDESDKDRTKIYSNSSSAAEFQQNKSLKSWREKYKDEKGLTVEFYELDPARFPTAGA
ncbi:hypothetical protein HFO33_32600 [Rhizobium leguminosarum]|uniref:hypothetical protein n=1 Tax=Rhizobium leguminosarum TaxID=384 RepID=UPI001C94FF7F|nr:hypothetical protein [Rhizobium leguminosarum]MBY5721243.1 hypothetical protein [Rhizobium leguminosarum]